MEVKKLSEMTKDELRDLPLANLTLSVNTFRNGRTSYSAMIDFGNGLQATVDPKQFNLAIYKLILIFRNKQDNPPVSMKVVVRLSKGTYTSRTGTHDYIMYECLPCPSTEEGRNIWFSGFFDKSQRLLIKAAHLEEPYKIVDRGASDLGELTKTEDDIFADISATQTHLDNEPA